MSNVPINGSPHATQASSEVTWKGAQALGRVHALNERSLELLTQLARTDRQQISLAIVNQHRSLWRNLSAAARKRAACTPFLLVDLHFQDAAWWRSAKDPRPSRRRTMVLHAAFTGKIAGELMRETLMLAWSTVAFDRGAARIMLGMTPAVSGIIGELGPQDVERIAGSAQCASSATLGGFPGVLGASCWWQRARATRKRFTGFVSTACS